MKLKENQWIGVDLDGTLAHYDGWKGHGHIGEPIVSMVERVRGWVLAGHRVKIFTARVHDASVADIKAIEAWCAKHIGRVLPVTNVKDSHMAELWDDRAVTVERNTGYPLAPSTRGL